MESESGHKFELYPFESFKTLLALEVNRTRRYKTPLTLIHLSIEIDPDTSENRLEAEMFAINTLDMQLRNTDIPCMKDGEFLILMPATDDAGGRAVCDRLAELFNAKQQKYDRVSFQMKAYIGMTFLGAGVTRADILVMEQAARAMNHARENNFREAAFFFDIK